LICSWRLATAITFKCLPPAAADLIDRPLEIAPIDACDVLRFDVLGCAFG